MIKTVFIPISVILVVIMLIMAGIVGAAPAEKVDVCHSEGNGMYHKINISENAFLTHAAHGDAGPGELVPDGTGAFDLNCNVVQGNIYGGKLTVSTDEWAHMSCPTGSTAIAGRVERVDDGEGDVKVQGLAVPGSTVGGYTYPIWPHHEFDPGETGWVVQNDKDKETLLVYVTCLTM